MLARDFLRFLGFKGRPRGVLMGKHLAGHTKTTGPYGELVDADMLQCVHCSFTWEVVVGSGIERGFCHRCMGYTCSPRCAGFCLTIEERLENEEAGRPRETPRPERSAVLEVPGVIVAKPQKLILPE